MRLLTIFLVFGMMVVSGCSFLDPKPDSSRYFLLRPMAEPGSVPALDELVLGLGPVTVPDYLDRIEMLEHVGPYEVRYSARDRWVEPLGTQIERTLAENLDALLQPQALAMYPWYRTAGVGLQVEIAFSPIRPDQEGAWRERAEWVVREADTRRILERQEFEFDIGSDLTPPEGVVTKLSEELLRLSGEIAAAVRRHLGRSR